MAVLAIYLRSARLARVQAGRSVREAIIERGEGALRDDATALLVEWRRGSEAKLLPQTV